MLEDNTRKIAQSSSANRKYNTVVTIFFFITVSSGIASKTGTSPLTKWCETSECGEDQKLLFCIPINADKPIGLSWNVGGRAIARVHGTS